MLRIDGFAGIDPVALMIARPTFGCPSQIVPDAVFKSRPKQRLKLAKKHFRGYFVGGPGWIRTNDQTVMSRPH